MMLLSLVFAVAGFALFGLAMDDHHMKRLGGKRPTAHRKQRLRVVAWLGIAASFPPAIASHGWIFGPVLWSGLVMLAAGLVFLTLNMAPASLALPRPGKPGSGKAP